MGAYFHSNQEILENEKFTHEKIDKNVLLFGCGYIIRRMSVLKIITQYEFNRIVCVSRDRAWGFEFFDDWIYAEHEDVNYKEETLQKIIEYTEKHNIKFDAIFTYDDFSALITSYVANYFKLPSIPFEVALTMKNKFKMRKWCSENGVSCPKFRLIECDQREYFTKQISNGEIQEINAINGGLIAFPLIVKNVNGCGKGW